MPVVRQLTKDAAEAARLWLFVYAGAVGSLVADGSIGIKRFPERCLRGAGRPRSKDRVRCIGETDSKVRYALYSDRMVLETHLGSRSGN